MRLDDRGSLLARLSSAGAGPAATDLQLVRAAYDRFGDGCPEQLLGDYAFALWDQPRRRFFCARDPFGVKPFYYHLSPEMFAVSSDAEALLQATTASRDLDPGPLVDYLYGVFNDTTATPYRQVARLPPGHVLVVEATRHHCRRHWRPEAVPELGWRDDAAYEEAFREAFSAAVASRLPTSAAGVYLSGGLDSSAVTCVGQRLYTGGRLRAFAAVFDGEPRSDERAYAAAAASQAGSDLVHCHPERTSPLAQWSGSPWRGPVPGCDTQVAVCQSITENAAELGVTVLLTGFGGDSVVSHGHAYLGELAGSLRVRRLVTEARAIARRHERPAWPLVRRYGVGPYVPAALLRRRFVRGVGPDSVPVRPDVAAAVGAPGRMVDLRRRAPARTARVAHLRELRSGQLAYALEASYAFDAAVGIERRHPFLDRRLAELCLSLPGDQKLRDGWSRSIMRRSLAGVLPDAVRFRAGKGDLSHAFQRSMLTTARPVLDALVARPDAVADWVDPAALDALWRRCRSGGKGPDFHALWRVAVLDAWLRHHGLAE